jgi:hypothetical protein
MALNLTDLSSSAPKRRRDLTDLERRNIRRRSSEHPGPQSSLISWFLEETGHRLNQSQISKILSTDYAYLDNDNRKPTALGAKRTYNVDWPELEGGLFEWQQRMQKKKAVINGDTIKAQASKLWNLLPQFEDLPEPKWSNGWLDGFKKRYKIKEFVQHGEGSSAEVLTLQAIQQMTELRLLCSQYCDQDIFNMDETGLFWKLTPNRTLATEARSGGKKSKDRVTLALTVNGDGSVKLEPWIIGKSQNPRCFKKINRRLLRVEYRHNKSKWMTGLIMEEYLRWFDNKMQGRKVLLLLDNFSGHELGVELVGGLQGLTNTRIAWLPPNTTSHWQPLDQGIIASFNLQYRRQWVAYMLRQFEANKDPNKTVTLLKAVQWTRVAWCDYVSSQTIQKCFWKSTITTKPDDNMDNLESVQDLDMDELRAQIAQLPRVIDPLSVEEFIEVPEEVIDDNDDDVTAAVVLQYSANKLGDESEEDDDDFEAPIVGTNEAIQALEALKLYIIQQDEGDVSISKALDKLGRDIQQKKRFQGKQTTVEVFFKSDDQDFPCSPFYCQLCSS